MDLRLMSLDHQVAVAGQLQPEDMPAVAAAGYAAVVNNRPDREALLGQPRTAVLAAAAAAAGLRFLDLPFSGPNASPEQVRALAGLLAANDGKVVAFCKSGMRSALLWAAAAVANGRAIDEVLTAARQAGQPLDAARDIVARLGAAAASD